MSNQAFQRKIEAVEALRNASNPEAALDGIRKALANRNNFLVSKAAGVAAELKLAATIPDLIAAFDRFLTDPVKSDPQCWAKNAIARALKELGHQDPHVFLRGIVHFQLEPVWGGRADTAATLRGTCALALIDCRLDDLEILTHLADRLADSDKRVRMDASVAVAQLGRPEGALLLRLKAMLGDREPEVTGQCFASLLALAPGESLEFIQRFLDEGNEDVRTEAACSLAQTRDPAAIEILRKFWASKAPFAVRRAMLISLGASPLREAADFLLAILRTESGELAANAVTALAASRYRVEMRELVESAIDAKQESELRRLFERSFNQAGR